MLEGIEYGTWHGKDTLSGWTGWDPASGDLSYERDAEIRAPSDPASLRPRLPRGFQAQIASNFVPGKFRRHDNCPSGTSLL